MSVDDRPAAGGHTTGMLDLLNGFVVELRNAGLPVSLTENLDAMEAVQHIPVSDREAFKYALAATLIKNNSHWRAFETVFEVYFSLRVQVARHPARRRPYPGQRVRGTSEIVATSGAFAGFGPRPRRSPTC